MWHKPPTVPEEHLGTSVCAARPHLPESGEGYRSGADPQCLGFRGSVQGWEEEHLIQGLKDGEEGGIQGERTFQCTPPPSSLHRGARPHTLIL